MRSKKRIFVGKSGSYVTHVTCQAEGAKGYELTGIIGNAGESRFVQITRKNKRFYTF